MWGNPKRPLPLTESNDQLGATPLLDTLVIISANGFCVIICYVLGYRKGIRERPDRLLARDTRDCVCGHLANSHFINREKWGGCTDKSRNGVTKCPCQIYVPKEESLNI